MVGSESGTPFWDKPLERSPLYSGMTCFLVTGPYKSYVNKTISDIMTEKLHNKKIKEILPT